MTALSIATILGGGKRSEEPDPRSLADEECAEKAGAGDNDAFSELVRRYQARVFRYLKRMVGRHDEASDLTQETFLRAYQSLGEWRHQAKFRTWLFRIAGNAAIDLLRRNRVHRPDSLAEVGEPRCGHPGVEQIHHANEQYAFLQRALSRVPEIYRQPLLLRELEGMTYTEIGALLELTEGTVKSRIARARAQLLDLFNSYGYS